MDADVYDEDYFLRGRQSGKSLYQDYRWLPELTVPMVSRIVAHCGIEKSHTILDFGCSRGYIVRAFRELGYQAYGVDVSEWAVKNADESVGKYCWLQKGAAMLSAYEDAPFWPTEFDWVIAKDVLEHVPNVASVIDDLRQNAKIGIFAVVPLSSIDGKRYEVEEYEKDITHIHRLSLKTWAGMFMLPEWTVEASYRVGGVKDNYASWAMGNGFIKAVRQ